MKKKSFKSLTLNKKSVSNLDETNGGKEVPCTCACSHTCYHTYCGPGQCIGPTGAYC